MSHLSLKSIQYGVEYAPCTNPFGENDIVTKILELCGYLRQSSLILAKAEYNDLFPPQLSCTPDGMIGVLEALVANDSNALMIPKVSVDFFDETIALMTDLFRQIEIEYKLNKDDPAHLCHTSDYEDLRLYLGEALPMVRLIERFIPKDFNIRHVVYQDPNTPEP